jgi:hypothetical protein
VGGRDCKRLMDRKTQRFGSANTFQSIKKRPREERKRQFLSIRGREIVRGALEKDYVSPEYTLLTAVKFRRLLIFNSCKTMEKVITSTISYYHNGHHRVSGGIPFPPFFVPQVSPNGEQMVQ